jgi:hypothetical protein
MPEYSDDSKRWKKNELSRSSTDVLANPNKPLQIKEKVKKVEKSKLQRLELKVKMEKLRDQKGKGKGTVGTHEQARREVMDVKNKADAKQQTERSKREKLKQEKFMRQEKSPSSSA